MDLASKQCQGKAKLLTENAISEYLKHINNNWQLANDDTCFKRTFTFNNYEDTMAFVNAVARIAQQQDHHPEMIVGYNSCTVQYSTRSIDGLSQFDFICAAKIDTISPT